MTRQDAVTAALSSTPEYESYNVPWHIVSLFFVLGCSLLGTVLPILGKRTAALRVPDYVYAIGKAAATGVVLGVALIHMLQPANESLTSECVPEAVRNVANPLAYIICLSAVAAMHSLEVGVRVYFELGGSGAITGAESEESEHLLSGSDAGGPPQHHHHHPVVAVDSDGETSGLQILSAVLLEFGVSLHSLFVGLTVGVCPDAELYTLMCALALHQFFEGVALGSRLVEAAVTPRTEYVFAAVFVLSAPLGAAVGIMCISEHLINTKNSSYLLTQGILDSVCAGILLYLGFQLLLTDFYADARAHVAAMHRPRGFVLAMLAALWLGIAIMAAIGQYL